MSVLCHIGTDTTRTRELTKMDKLVVTDKLVKGLTPPESGNTVTYDGTAPDAIRGFGVRITANGARSFILNFRLHGTEYRHTIGAYPTWTVQAAREEAKRLRKEIDKGINPVLVRREQREAETVKQLAQRYIDEYLPRKAPSSQPKDKAMLAHDILPAIGRLKVADVTVEDVERLHGALTKRGTPIWANRVLALASKIFALAIKWRMRSDNPCRGIERNPENQRRRYLSPAEIAALSDALARYPNQDTADVVRLCLLTGCRSGEAMAARWEQIDLARGIWTKTASDTKQRRLHSVPLSAPALMLLTRLREQAAAAATFVFPGRKSGKPMATVRYCWKIVTTAARIEDAHIHDLRHSFASIAASGGASLPLIGALLGHSQIRTTQRYAHLFDDALRQIADRVGATITKPAAEIVQLHKDGAA
jgi:integrase